MGNHENPFFRGPLMANHQADIQNPNKGTPGNNKAYDKNQGNRGQQLNPNQQNRSGSKSGGGKSTK